MVSAELPPLRAGCLIAFEGIDGAGKTTQARLLEEFFVSRGVPVVYTKEPTGGHYRQTIEEWIRTGERPSPEDELRVFTEDRREHVQEVIRPALDEKKVVLLDRYFLSTAAYQGERGFDPAAILDENESFAPLPDIAFYLRISVETALERIAARGNGTNLFERGETLKVVARIFDAIDRDYLVEVDGEESIDSVSRVVRGALEDWMRARRPPDPLG